MPKKRYPTHQYTKPPTTAPSALASSSHSHEPSSSSTSSSTSKNKSVNDLLSTLRSAPAVDPHHSRPAEPLTPTPTLPAPLRALLAIPDSAPPPPRRRQRVDEFGRRLPAGPAPPRSWLTSSIHNPLRQRYQNQVENLRNGAKAKGKGSASQDTEEDEQDFRLRTLEHLPAGGALAFPPPRSLKAHCLRNIASHWNEFQEIEQWNLAFLPTEIRMLVCSFVAAQGGGIGYRGLKALLVPGGVDGELEDVEGHIPASAGEENSEESEEDEDTWESFVDSSSSLSPDHFAGNEDFTRLDLAGSIGRGGIGLKQVMELLTGSSTSHSKTSSDHPAARSESQAPSTPASSSSRPNDSDHSDTPTSSIPKSPAQPILPIIHHLSLARPSTPASVTWITLLSLSKHLPTLQSLSLAHWPIPTLTPNALTASVILSSASPSANPALGLNYGATGMYSHTLDDDFSEAAGILNRLAKRLYSLEYLDVDGCASWARALSWSPSTRSPRASGIGSVSKDTSTAGVLNYSTNWAKLSTISLRQGLDLESLAIAQGKAEERSENEKANINTHLLAFKQHVLLAEHLEKSIRRSRLHSQKACNTPITVLQDSFNEHDDLWISSDGRKIPGKEEVINLLGLHFLAPPSQSQRQMQLQAQWVGEAGDYAEEALFWDSIAGFGVGLGTAVNAWEP